MINAYWANRRSDERDRDHSLAGENSKGQRVLKQEESEAPLLVNRKTTQQTCIEVPLTASQLAEIVPLHPVTLLRWAREGRIPHRRLSARKILFLPSEIQRWLADGSCLYPRGAGRAAQPERRAA